MGLTSIVPLEGESVYISLVLSDEELRIAEAARMVEPGSLATYAKLHAREFVEDLFAANNDESGGVRSVRLTDGMTLYSAELGDELFEMLAPQQVINLDITRVLLQCYVTPPSFIWEEPSTAEATDLFIRRVKEVAQLVFSITVEPPNLAG